MLVAASLISASPAGAQGSGDPSRTELRTAGEPTLSVIHEQGPGPSVVYVHGATFPAALSVAYRIDDVSWMDDLRARGFDVWAFDMAGYGSSERDARFADASPDAPPQGRAAQAARQLERVVEEVKRVRGVSQVDIIAHSWGTLPAGVFAASHPAQVRRLVLFGPVAPRSAPAEEALRGAAILVTAQSQRDSFAAGAPEAKPFLDETVMEAWQKAYLATDPQSGQRTPPAVRVPAGPIADTAEAWSGSFPFPVSKIKAPTLLVRGSWDNVSTAADLQTLARLMTGARRVEVVTLADGGHRMHLERNRQRLFEAVGDFLGPAVNKAQK